MRARQVSGRMFLTTMGPMHARVDGPTHGPAIVLIHGFAGSVHWFDRVVSLSHPTTASFGWIRLDPSAPAEMCTSSSNGSAISIIPVVVSPHGRWVLP